MLNAREKIKKRSDSSTDAVMSWSKVTFDEPVIIKCEETELYTATLTQQSQHGDLLDLHSMLQEPPETSIPHSNPLLACDNIPDLRLYHKEGSSEISQVINNHISSVPISMTREGEHQTPNKAINIFSLPSGTPDLTRVDNIIIPLSGGILEVSEQPDVHNAEVEEIFGVPPDTHSSDQNITSRLPTCEIKQELTTIEENTAICTPPCIFNIPSIKKELDIFSEEMPAIDDIDIKEERLAVADLEINSSDLHTSSIMPLHIESSDDIKPQIQHSLLTGKFTQIKVCSVQLTRLQEWKIQQWTRNAHQQTVSDLKEQKKPFSCSKCPKVCKSLPSLASHITREHTHKKLLCALCKFTSKNKCVLSLHFIHHHLKITRYQCDICHLWCQSRSSLKLHIKSKHRLVTLDDNVMVWQKRPNKKKKKQRRIKTPYKFKCIKCGKHLRTYFGLTIHMNAHEQGRMFKCDICGNAFSADTTLQMHIKTVHSTKHDFKCDKCDKTFPLKGYLTKHQRSHSNARPFPCSKCDIRFKSQGELTRHSRKHNDDPDQTHSCQVCGKKYGLIDSLRYHMIHSHDEKAIKCSKCYKKFKNEKSIQRHMKTHK